MNRNQVFAAIALVVAGSSAFAGDEFNPQTGFAQDGVSVSAAQVRAETQAARRDGALNVTRDDQLFAKTVSVVSRADVKAELAEARANGPIVGDTTLQFEQEPVAASSLTREEVRAATRTALRSARAANGS